jgi:hypothetical protein
LADKAWKQFERRIAKLFGCKRRGPLFRTEHGGTDDLTHDFWAVECKLLSVPTFGAMLEACRQAEASARVHVPGPLVGETSIRERQPIAIVKKKGAADEDALVVMRLAAFKAWHL